MPDNCNRILFTGLTNFVKDYFFPRRHPYLTSFQRDYANFSANRFHFSVKKKTYLYLIPYAFSLFLFVSYNDSLNHFFRTVVSINQVINFINLFKFSIIKHEKKKTYNF